MSKAKSNSKKEKKSLVDIRKGDTLLNEATKTKATPKNKGKVEGSVKTMKTAKKGGSAISLKENSQKGKIGSEVVKSTLKFPTKESEKETSLGKKSGVALVGLKKESSKIVTGSVKTQAKGSERKVDGKTPPAKVILAPQKPVGGDKPEVGSVKGLKNQIAINRLILMFDDIRPEQLDPDTIDDLKTIYSHLAQIQTYNRA